jgi:hypothetical protein
MRLRPGFCGVIGGKAVMLLFLVNRSGESETWRSRLIFVPSESQIDVTIRTGEILRPIHG